jgi:hypothetical protein
MAKVDSPPKYDWWRIWMYYIVPLTMPSGWGWIEGGDDDE